MKRVIIFAVTLLVTFYTLPSFSKDTPGIVIEDKSPYPLHQYSQLTIGNELPSLLLKNIKLDNYSIIVSILENMGIPFQVVSESPAVFQTDWISWHYDTETRKTLSNHTNRFFKLNLRDKYQFRISVNDIQQHPVITLNEINRKQEVDITPDTEMVWLKWQKKEPNSNAINDFMKRLQTEYEIQVLASNSPVTQETSNTRPTSSNYIALNMTVNQAWSALIKQLKNSSITLANTHNNQHMLNTDWIYAEYSTDTNDFNFSLKDSQRHQFQLMVIPGPSVNSSSIFAYHTGFEQKSNTSTWSDSTTQESIAGAFLDFLNLKQ